MLMWRWKSLDSLKQSQSESCCHGGAPSEQAASWGWEPGLSHHLSQGGGQPQPQTSSFSLGPGWCWAGTLVHKWGVRLWINGAMAGQGRDSPVPGEGQPPLSPTSSAVWRNSPEGHQQHQLSVGPESRQTNPQDGEGGCAQASDAS